MTTDKNSSLGKAKGLLGSSSLDAGRDVSRRRFLLTTGALAGLGTVIYASFDLGAAKRIIKNVRRRTFDSNSPTGRLSEQEMETMIALLEVLVPSELWFSREAMAEMVNNATENYKGVLKEYKAGLFLLDQVAGVRGVSLRFAEASIQERQRVLESLMWKYEAARRTGPMHYVKLKLRLERLFHSEAERRFRDLVVRDLLMRFYVGGGAWKLVGYSHYPGVPGDPREYVRPLSSE